MKRITWTILFVLLAMSTGDNAGAETVACPDMGLALKPGIANAAPGQVYTDYIRDIHSGSANCEYGPKNRMLLSWYSSLDRDTWQKRCGQRRSLEGDGPVHVKFAKDKRWVILSSKTNLSLVYIWLSPKEYRKRRQEWADAGRRLLDAEVRRGMSCEAYSPGTSTRSQPEVPVPQQRPSEPAAAPKRYAPNQQGRDPSPSRPATAPQIEKRTPEPAAQPDDVDAKIDDILERLQSE